MLPTLGSRIKRWFLSVCLSHTSDIFPSLNTGTP